MAFHRPSFSPSFERAPHTLPPRIPCWAVVRRLNSFAGFAEPALSLYLSPAEMRVKCGLGGERERDVWCLLFVSIRHGEEGAASLHAGLERLGKETAAFWCLLFVLVWCLLFVFGAFRDGRKDREFFFDCKA